MILTDQVIISRLSEFEIIASNPSFPFDAVKQIQPSSIDLRLSNVIWIPRKGKAIDLISRDKMGEDIANAFVRQTFDEKKGYKLKAGKFVLGRTYEAFKIPHDLQGQLIGRSSLGRLGLSVTSPSGFINPNWQGHMPLMLINHSPFDIIIHPYLGIVQLCLQKLEPPPSKIYGAAGLGSKYLQDDGGPSKYWLDETVKALNENLGLQRVTAKGEKYFTYFSSKLDEPTRFRFQKFLKKLNNIHEVEETISRFVESEKKRAFLIKIMPLLFGAPFVVFHQRLNQFLSQYSFGEYYPYGVYAFVIGVILWLVKANYTTAFSYSDLRKIAESTKDAVDKLLKN